MTGFSSSYFTARLDEMISLLGEIVTIESPTTDKAAVDVLGCRIAAELRDLGAQVMVFEQSAAGDHVMGRWGDGPGGILLLSHIDTVFDLGTIRERPFSQSGGRLFGPGVQDMKASIAMLLAGLRGFKREGIWPNQPIIALFTTDEETGSLTSRALIEAEARRAGVVFTLEPALPNGALKTARKGTGDIEIHVRGVASHAGASHEKGRNAVEELAHHILAAQRLTDYARGTTVNVGVVSGGTRANVVPGEAHALIDLRVTRMDEYLRLEEWASGLAPVIDGCQVKAEITLNRPPMPRDATMIRAYEKAREIGRSLGLELEEGSTGGGSDANFVAPLGIPVLDGLGAVGDGAHSEREYVKVESLPERTALLAALMLNW